jgi:hypothetical protein
MHAAQAQTRKDQMDKEARQKRHDDALFQAAMDKVAVRKAAVEAKQAPATKPESWARVVAPAPIAPKPEEKAMMGRLPQVTLTQKAVVDWQAVDSSHKSVFCKLHVGDVHGAQKLPGPHEATIEEAQVMLRKLRGEVPPTKGAVKATVQRYQAEALAQSVERGKQIQADRALAAALDQQEADAKEQIERDERLATQLGEQDRPSPPPSSQGGSSVSLSSKRAPWKQANADARGQNKTPGKGKKSH